MIITLTPNPSTDRTLVLDGPLERGAVQRLIEVTSQAGGKGVNISRAATMAATPTLAVLPAEADDPFVAELAKANIASLPVAPAGRVRTNVTVTEPGGTTTKLNSPGEVAHPSMLEALAAAVLERAAEASWVVLAGSIPPGTPVGWYADLVAALRAQGAQVAVDTSDAPLAEIVSRLAQCAPTLMKPNGHELASFAGADGDSLEADPQAAASLARQLLIDRGVAAALVTLGAGGAVLVNADGAWHAASPPTTVISTVGAGDSSLFGYLLADLRGLAAPDRLALAVAYGAAAAGMPGTTIPAPHQTHPELAIVRELNV